MPRKLLFLCKKRNDSYGYGPSYGLVNSCRFIANALRKHNVECIVDTVTDANDIDREVHHHKPTDVFIEALWVTPKKLAELERLHKCVQWRVRIHSKIPFLASEGVAIEWLSAYSRVGENVSVAANSTEAATSICDALHIRVGYYPNIYCPPDYDFGEQPPALDSRLFTDMLRILSRTPDFINIGCFGAIRPLKNQLQQALAAIAYGDSVGKHVRFHMNSDRVETFGDPVLTNIKAVFARKADHSLVLHPWLPHNEFVRLVRRMDIGMQVSLSETFDIVAADFAWNSVPIIASPEVSWLPRHCQCDPNDTVSIVSALTIAANNYGILTEHALLSLMRHNEVATNTWLEALK